MLCVLPGPAQLGKCGKAPRHFVCSSRTISETWEGMEFELLFVTHLNKISDSLMLEQKVIFGVSSLLLQFHSIQ